MLHMLWQDYWWCTKRRGVIGTIVNIVSWLLMWWQCSQPQQYPLLACIQFNERILNVVIFFLYFIFLCVLCWVSWKVPHGNTKDNVDNCCGDLVGMQKWWYRQKVTGGRAQTLQVTTHIAVVFLCPILFGFFRAGGTPSFWI
jgi:hypothetical protein